MENTILDSTELIGKWGNPAFLKRMKIVCFLIYFASAANFIGVALQIFAFLSIDLGPSQKYIDVVQIIMLTLFGTLLFLAARPLQRYCSTSYISDLKQFSNYLAGFFASMVLVILVVIILFALSVYFH